MIILEENLEAFASELFISTSINLSLYFTILIRYQMHELTQTNSWVFNN